VALDDYERVHAENRAEWRCWLGANHARAPGAWLVSWKTATGKPRVGYAESVEEALCFGWIDSLSRTVDEERTQQLFTPRRPGSRWSRSNKERVERLQADGLIEPAGLAAIETAKAGGAWTALDDVENLVVPDDLAAAFAARADAAAHWESFPPSVRSAILLWILDAKRPETRAKRIAETASEAAAGRRPGQWGRTVRTKR
jgi:uncharacterized protein YdeI (YjbR/CyaY-like superfamily)